LIAIIDLPYADDDGYRIFHLGILPHMFTASPTSHSYISQRLKLHYVDWGNPTAPPLLLVHGGRDHCRSWDWVADRLRHDWHVMAMDLRGHGDSAWSPDGDYTMAAYVYDIAQIVHQLELAPVNIVAHSLGGNVALRYAGLYPENVRRIVAIEGLGPSPKMQAERLQKSLQQRWAEWIRDRRAVSARSPRRYANLSDALERMRSENKYLTPEQAQHLTLHAASRNEDGTWSWKFDNYMHVFPPVDLTPEELQTLWHAISCPTLLCYGDKSGASNPEKDGRVRHFKQAQVISFADAGHWVHHDALDGFMQALHGFL
jgi:pimeloyl-ACP methyl ester carboxylesterase